MKTIAFNLPEIVHAQALECMYPGMQDKQRCLIGMMTYKKVHLSLYRCDAKYGKAILASRKWDPENESDQKMIDGLIARLEEANIKYIVQ